MRGGRAPQLGVKAEEPVDVIPGLVADGNDVGGLDTQIQELLKLHSELKAKKAMKANKAMKAMKAMKPMKTKKAMKTTKTKKAVKTKTASKIAKGRKAKSKVLRGSKEKTVGGLTHSDLILNKNGRTRNLKRMIRHKNNPWIDACEKAKVVLGLTGMVKFTKGSEAHRVAKEIYQ